MTQKKRMPHEEFDPIAKYGGRVVKLGGSASPTFASGLPEHYDVCWVASGESNYSEAAPRTLVGGYDLNRRDPADGQWKKEWFAVVTTEDEETLALYGPVKIVNDHYIERPRKAGIKIS